MLGKLKNAVNLLHNMGWRYAGFRGKHEFLRRSGLLKAKFPINPSFKQLPGLQRWKIEKGAFFFDGRDHLSFAKIPSASLKERFDHFKDNRLLFFNSTLFDVGAHYDWITNPENGYRYDIHKHWTEIADYSKEAGDIKVVWEKSRFSFLYDIVRYDYHFGADCARIALNEIVSWIRYNPVNCGPNWRCSQEISLRVLNWIFALYYYQDSKELTEEVFEEIMQSIYWQIHHVYHNIDFSRIAVRNNHAITETLTLYLAGLFFPYIQDFQYWGVKGKKWFEEEIAYQVYDDGTFLQFSMNYHRVVVQLLTWGIRLSDLNKSKLAPVVHERAVASLKFLRVCMNDHSGWLPNYGANDGALFFKLNDAHYRDYRPQLDALASVLAADADISPCEDAAWYGCADIKPDSRIDLSRTCYSFDTGGYYVVREKEMLTFIRCGSHRDRPSQADNLHLDIWYRGENLFMDAGSYKYNTDEATLRYFMGTESHNTVMINGADQMRKGSRFIWFNWTQAVSAELNEEREEIHFKGIIKAFGHFGREVLHERCISKLKGQPKWTVQDTFENLPERADLKQLWHLPAGSTGVSIVAETPDGDPVNPHETAGWYAPFYGKKEVSRQIEFETTCNGITATIQIDL